MRMTLPLGRGFGGGADGPEFHHCSFIGRRVRRRAWVATLLHGSASCGVVEAARRRCRPVPWSHGASLRLVTGGAGSPVSVGVWSAVAAQLASSLSASSDGDPIRRYWRLVQGASAAVMMPSSMALIR
jgi:hypothetical protein